MFESIQKNSGVTYLHEKLPILWRSSDSKLKQKTRGEKRHWGILRQLISLNGTHWAVEKLARLKLGQNSIQLQPIYLFFVCHNILLWNWKQTNQIKTFIIYIEQSRMGYIQLNWSYRIWGHVIQLSRRPHSHITVYVNSNRPVVKWHYTDWQQQKS